MRQLLDGDPAENGGNWQWVASVGADAMPAFRIFNPITQARRFDPSGDYVRRWVPELVSRTGTAVHAPWEHGGAPGYPSPIVEHDDARRRVTEAVRRARPEIILTAPPIDYMSDHEMTSRLVRDAAFNAPIKNFATHQWEPAAPIAHVPHLYYVDPIEGTDYFG